MSNHKTTNHLNLISWLRLVRWPNLLILAGIQGLAGVFICTSSATCLIGLILMTACATAAGYVVNDVCDQNADSINHRQNEIVLGHLQVGHAMNLYRALNGLGALVALSFGLWVSLHFLWIYAALVFLLWWYSKRLKGIAIIGNLTVSALCATAVLLLCWCCEIVPDQLIWLAAFAFLVTWIREIIKDLEDMHGDLEGGYRTLPIVIGPAATKRIAAGLTVIVIGCLATMSYAMDWSGWFKWLLLFVTLVLLLHYGVVRTLQATSSGEYRRISTILKFIMLTGTLCLIF
jgi:4-hydroxybenzoate polyprenyltransferase